MILLPEFFELEKNNQCMSLLSQIGCVWDHIRFKPPMSFDKDKAHWLVEFRPMDVPILPKEITAVIFFLTLFQRMISDKKLGVNFYMPISKINQNYESAFKIDSQTKEKFFFRKYFCKALHDKMVEEDDLVLITFEEFLTGNAEFDGMKALINKFIELNKTQLKEESVKTQ